MTKTQQSLLPQSAPIPVLLGVSDPAYEDWDRMRALQFQGLKKIVTSRLVTNLLAIVVLCGFFYQSVDMLWMTGWSLISTGFLVYSYIWFDKQAYWDRKKVTRRESNLTSLHSVGVGLIWGSGLWLFGRDAGFEDLVAISAQCWVLMIGAALLMKAVPLSACIFVTIMAAAQAFVWMLFGSPIFAIISIGFAIVLILACLDGAQAFVKGKIAESTLGEKDETVSLLLREFEDSSADWLWQTSKTRKITHVSKRFARALGIDAADIEGKPFLQLVAGDAWESGKFPSGLHDLAEQLKRRESFSNLLVPVTIGGQNRWWELSASPKLDDDGVFQGYRGVGSDVTEQRESAEKISYMARFDTLTGLPNRLQLTETLAKAIQDTGKWSGRCGLMMIDLDRFKSVNDTLGHPIGDRLLAKVSQRLQSIVEKDDLCGRLGGDEFALVLHDASDATKVSILARKIIDTLSRPYEVDQHTLYIGASIGTAVGPRDGRTVEMLMRSADLALYRSKNDGGGSHNSYEPKLHVHAEERRVMEIALRKALDQKELFLNYQPVVAADTGGVVGFEALLRWANPKFGNVSPAKFIPLAEEARLITPIGSWVMHQACRAAMDWPEATKVAVNVSADQLSDPNFIETVVSSLSSSGLPAHRLEIEVTESIFLREGTGSEAMLDQIIAMGINLSLDDFGTGYSSLGYLRKTRFNTIKVDRSFVQGAAKNIPESLAIIRAVVAMADSLGMSTTAEGTETEEEVEMVRQLGCKKIQGYYFGRPMSEQDAAALFNRGQRSVA